MTDSNRRRHTRVKVKQVSTRLKAQGGLHIGLAVDNISVGGAYVRSNTPLAVGAEVTLEVQRPGAATVIPVMGRVVSSVSPQQAQARGQPAGMGIAFFPMPRDILHRVEGLVAAVDPSAVRVAIEAHQANTDPAIPVVGAPGLPPAVELKHLQAEVASLTVQVKARDQRIAALEGQVEQLKQRLLLTSKPRPR